LVATKSPTEANRSLWAEWLLVSLLLPASLCGEGPQAEWRVSSTSITVGQAVLVTGRVPGGGAGSREVPVRVLLNGKDFLVVPQGTAFWSPGGAEMRSMLPFTCSTT